MSAVGLVSDGHRSFRCIYILPRRTDDVNLQGDVFVFLFDGQGGTSSPEKAHHPARRTRHIWLRFRFWAAFFPQHEEQGGIVLFFLFEILSIRIFLKKLADILKFHLLF